MHPVVTWPAIDGPCASVADCHGKDVAGIVGVIYVSSKTAGNFPMGPSFVLMFLGMLLLCLQLMVDKEAPVIPAVPECPPVQALFQQCLELDHFKRPSASALLQVSQLRRNGRTIHACAWIGLQGAGKRMCYEWMLSLARMATHIQSTSKDRLEQL